MGRLFSYTSKLVFKILIFGVVMGGIFAWTVRPIQETPHMVPARLVRQDAQGPGHFVNIEDQRFAGLAESLNKIEPAAAPAFEPLPVPVIAQKPQEPQEEREILSWEKNAVATDVAPGKPMIAIVIDDLGMGRHNTRRSSDLPGPLTMAFLPYAEDLPKQTAYAHGKGHELIVHVPMEPEGKDFPGPGALLTMLDEKAIRARLDKSLDAFEGYVGINNHMGSKFTSTPEKLALVMEVLEERGLLFLDSKTSPRSAGVALAEKYGVAHASRDVFLDDTETAEAVAKSLRETEAVARQQGYAIAIGHPKDITLDALESWLPTLAQKGFQLVSVSTIIRVHSMQEVPAVAIR